METHKPGEAIGLDAQQITAVLETFKLRLLLDYPFFGDRLHGRAHHPLEFRILRDAVPGPDALRPDA